MPSRNELCPCSSGRKYQQCCLEGARQAGGYGPRTGRGAPSSEVDPLTAEAAVLTEEVMTSPDALERVSDYMVLLRTMFREGGPLACLRWSWEEFVPPLERHIFRVMEEVEDMDERHARLFERCAPELLSPELLERFEQVLRRELTRPERTKEERRALSLALLELRTAPRHPPYQRHQLQLVAWLMSTQVDEWVARRQRMDVAVARALGAEPGARRGKRMSPEALRRLLEDPEAVMAAVKEAAESDPEMVEILVKYEHSLLISILQGRTPEVLYGEEWLWLTVVLREPLRLDPKRELVVDVPGLLAKLDEEVTQAILTRVEAASRDRSSDPEAQQWFTWAYKVLQVRPLAFFGAYAKALGAPLRERFEGEASLVRELRRRERWRAEDLEPYRLTLEARGAHGAGQRVRRLQAVLRGDPSAAKTVFKV